MDMNKPVAWMKNQYSPDIGEWVDYREDALEGYIPLYTHPVKELTDEEIEEVINTLDADFGLDDFARALLKKVSEK